MAARYCDTMKLFEEIECCICCKKMVDKYFNQILIYYVYTPHNEKYICLTCITTINKAPLSEFRITIEKLRNNKMTRDEWAAFCDDYFDETDNELVKSGREKLRNQV